MDLSADDRWLRDETACEHCLSRVALIRQVHVVALPAELLDDDDPPSGGLLQ